MLFQARYSVLNFDRNALYSMYNKYTLQLLKVVQGIFQSMLRRFGSKHRIVECPVPLFSEVFQMACKYLANWGYKSWALIWWKMNRSLSLSYLELSTSKNGIQQFYKRGSEHISKLRDPDKSGCDRIDWKLESQPLYLHKKSTVNELYTNDWKSYTRVTLIPPISENIFIFRSKFH